MSKRVSVSRGRRHASRNQLASGRWLVEAYNSTCVLVIIHSQQRCNTERGGGEEEAEKGSEKKSRGCARSRQDERRAAQRTMKLDFHHAVTSTSVSDLFFFSPVAVSYSYSPFSAVTSLLILGRTSRHYVAAGQSNMSLARLHVMLPSACTFSSIRKLPIHNIFIDGEDHASSHGSWCRCLFLTRSNGDAKISTAF